MDQMRYHGWRSAFIHESVHGPLKEKSKELKVPMYVILHRILETGLATLQLEADGYGGVKLAENQGMERR